MYLDERTEVGDLQAEINELKSEIELMRMVGGDFFTAQVEKIKQERLDNG